MKKHALSLHVFRRDLRLDDNTALLQALSDSDTVIPCFIFDERQVEKNAYKSMNAIHFMAASLNELNDALLQKNSQLYFFYGIAEDIIDQLISNYPIDAVHINRDYTPFSIKRDKRIEAICKKNNVSFYCLGDALLTEPELIHKSDGTPYTIYTAFYNKAKEWHVPKPIKNKYHHYYHGTIKHADRALLNDYANKISRSHLIGGRKEALRLIKQISELNDYQTERNYPAKQQTTHLSPHNKFGTASIREVYHAILDAHGHDHTLIKELYWRDFFTHIAFHFPHVFGHAFHNKYDGITWGNNKTKFDAWCKGMTGFPIVDAGMRELNETGYMHNRVRMITASFLVKDLHIDWRWGEKYFAHHLIDYDPSVNNGNWQWAASTGCDAQPYFRIFNPWRQQQTYDADCDYIKQWIPELRSLNAKDIHSLEKAAGHANYPEPIVNHSIAARSAKELYKR